MLSILRQSGLALQLCKKSILSSSNTSSVLIRSNHGGSLGSNAMRQERKRFYKNVSVIETDNKTYEINLDKRKLKSPSGKTFTVKSELLANMCANEWNSQTKSIKLGTMHLTSLVNTCLDNPNNLTKEGLIKGLVEYLHTDTVLFFDSPGTDTTDKLVERQDKKWRPLVDWFNQKL